MSSSRAFGFVHFRCRSFQTNHSHPVARMQPIVGPVIDLASLQGPLRERSQAVDAIGKACHDNGFFQVINHGVSPSITSAALRSAEQFFDLPMEEKTELLSADIARPVRCGTCNQDHYKDDSHVERFFLKHYSHPLERWINQWPSKPLDYRQDMGQYAVEVRKVALEVMEAIMESLGLGREYLQNKLSDGLQVMVVNGYPVHQKHELVDVGIPPHSDYSIITVIYQSFHGLEEFDLEKGKWNLVQGMPGSLLVQVGNFLEVLSNGRYKSAIHRVGANPRRIMRVSIASLHSLAMEEKVEVAEEFVDEDHPKEYRDGSFKGFLEFLSGDESGTLGEGKSYLDILKITE